MEKMCILCLEHPGGYIYPPPPELYLATPLTGKEHITITLEVISGQVDYRLYRIKDLCFVSAVVVILLVGILLEWKVLDTWCSDSKSNSIDKPCAILNTP